MVVKTYIRGAIEHIATNMGRLTAEVSRFSFDKAKTPNRINMDNISTMNTTVSPESTISEGSNYTTAEEMEA